MTVSSFDGVDVTITDNSRIVAADRYGTLTDTVALGLGDNLVGRDTAAKFPAVRTYRWSLGGQSLNAEAILDSESDRGPHRHEHRAADRAGSVARRRYSRRLLRSDANPRRCAGPDPRQSPTRSVCPRRAGELAARTESEIAAARIASPAGDDPLKIAFLYCAASAITMIGGAGSGADSLIEALGAIDAGTASGITQQFAPITSEALIAAAPDVLLMMTDGLDIDRRNRRPREDPWHRADAGRKEQRVVDMEDGVLLSFGPNTGRVLAALADASTSPVDREQRFVSADS